MSVRTTRRTQATVTKNKPGGLTMNRKDLRSVRAVALDNYDAEYMYLRENELTQFDTDVKLDSLRVLDLSINDIGGAVDFLERTPHLRHLYMTGNKIETLIGISNFAALETLCLSDNAISSFDGLQNLPSLRVLSLNFNNISTFEAYPVLSCLHTLNLVGNPVTEVPSYRSMAVAINCPDLVSIDGNPVQEEERAAVEQYRGKVEHCIREGFMVEGENVEEAAEQYMLKVQQRREASKFLQLCAIRLVSDNKEDPSILIEGQPVRFSLCMQDIRPYVQRTTEIFHSRHLYPVIFKVSGEATEVFVVGSMNQWTDPIELERCEEDGEIYFHTTLYLPAGDYEYRYIVDGAEKVSETNRIMSQFEQGYCNLYQVTELEPQEEEQDTILHIRWMRGGPTGVFEVIEDENGLEYTPCPQDIGSCLRAEMLAYVEGEFSFLYFNVSSPVVAAMPHCPHLEIKGNPVEGTVLTAETDYAGGVEGSSSLSWFRVVNNQRVPIEVADPWAGYKLTMEDIGYSVGVEFTPVRNDWVAGEPRSETTPTVTAGPPECESIRIVGNLVEGSQLEVDVVYSGGQQGDSFYQWLRKVDGTEQYVPILGQNDVRYRPTLEDVGQCLAVEYTPVSADGVEGETCRCVLENPIEACAPVVRAMQITGELTESSVLTLEYIYAGGVSGKHLIQWYRQNKKHGSVKIGRPNSDRLILTSKEIGSMIEVTFTPVRADGIRGRTMMVSSTGEVTALPPHILNLNIVGEPKAYSTLTIEAEYTGGAEGSSVVSWLVENPQTQVFEVVAPGTRQYTVQPEDVGKVVRVSYIPVNQDGVEGPEATCDLHIAAAVVKSRNMSIASHTAPKSEPLPETEEVSVTEDDDNIFEEEEEPEQIAASASREASAKPETPASAANAATHTEEKAPVEHSEGAGSAPAPEKSRNSDEDSDEYDEY